MQTTPSMNWGRETSPRPCIPRNERNLPRIRSLLHVAPISQNDQPQRIERTLLAQTVRIDGQSLSKSGRTAKFLNSYTPPRDQYCFGARCFTENCDPRHPKLGNGSENRCSFILDENTTNSNLLDRILYGFAELPDYDSKHVRQCLVIQTRGRARPPIEE